MKFYQSGRSMVEMLGVLAIIGVLSVGAIAGYSKAMMKYKLNKHLESVNLLLNYSLQNVSSFKLDESQNRYSEIMHKLNLIPDGIIYRNQRLYDIFGNWISVYSNVFETGSYEYVFWIQIDKSDINSSVCQNIAEISRANSSNIVAFETVAADSEGSDGNVRFWGDGYCSSGRKCIKNMSINDIDELCHYCTEGKQNCRMAIVWY